MDSFNLKNQIKRDTKYCNKHIKYNNKLNFIV